MNTSLAQRATVRLATVDDAEAITAIYNYYVQSSTSTWQTEEETPDIRRKRLLERTSRDIVTVVEALGEVRGWASLSPYKPRGGYRPTADESIYLRHDASGQGLGTLLLRDLFGRGLHVGYQTVIAGISADQAPSLALHRKLGFVEVGCLQSVGIKFDQQLDSILMQLLPQDMARFAQTD